MQTKCGLPLDLLFLVYRRCSYTGSLHANSSATIHLFGFVLGSLKREQSKLNFQCVAMPLDSVFFLQSLPIVILGHTCIITVCGYTFALTFTARK